MASRNYYVVLGVASNESDQGVRAAFRDLAKRYHPDRVGAAGAVPFREVVEAYETLGDPERRNDYDESLRTPRESPPVGLERGLSLRRDLAEVRPSKDALFARIARNFTGVGASKGERVEELTVEIAISEEEAGRGTLARLGVPVFGRCSRCTGSGCAACHGHGVVETERAVSIDIPPMSGSGTTFVMPLSGLGIHNFYLHVRVRVDRATEPRET
jgi:DnaJ-class molecular chaperone